MATPAKGQASGSSNSIRIAPYYYIHVLDRNSNVTRLEIGPQTYVRKEDESITTGSSALKMIVLPPRHYCEITDPVVRNELGVVQFDKYNQAIIKYGEVDYRFADQWTEPFPLHPNERLSKPPTQLTVVKENSALKIEASRNFTDKDKKEIKAGDRWIFPGPATYYPRVEERVIEWVDSFTVKEQSALKLRTTQQFTDRTGQIRKTGEEWIVSTPGSYLPDVYEEVVEVLQPKIITNSTAIELRAVRNFVDAYKKERKAGEEWLVTIDMSSSHILDVYEEFVQSIAITILSKDEYCVILDPFESTTGKNKLGSKKLVCGERSFFLQPGESLESGILPIYILADDEALLLRAKEAFTDKDGDKKDHQPGDKWMVYGPIRFVPPTEVEVLALRKRIPLDKNEGIYVRDTREGSVRRVVGEAYMLKPHEELWEMDLADTVEELIEKQSTSTAKRDKTKVVSYKCPFNHAVQVYDYKKRDSRVVFGPDLLMLGPDEQFTVTVLSGGKPKKPGVIKTIDINLGPEFSTDIVVVETLDHARLKLQLSYNWYFRVSRDNQEEAQKIFNVKDFIGDMCNLMASKIRSAVAAVSFEAFHKSSAKLIRKSIFGVDKAGKIVDDFYMPKNNLVITNVDIQSVEPVDEKTQKSLQNSVTLAIQRTTKNQEDRARIQADRMEQEAMGELDKQKIEDQAKAESARKKLLLIQAESKSVQNSGQAIAEAKARAEAEEIEATSSVVMAELKANAAKIEYESQLKAQIEKQKIEIEYEQKMSDLEINRSKQLAEIESKKFDELIGAIGRETLVAMAEAGPEFQAKLLQGLGLSGYLITDGNNPINLFNAAESMIGQSSH